MNDNQRSKKSPGFIIAIVLACIAVVLTSTFLLLKFTGKEDKNQAKQDQEKNIIVEEDFEELFREIEEEAGEKTVEDKEEESETARPMSDKIVLQYLPEAGMILTYMHFYPDGTEGEEREVIGQMDPGIVVSKAIMLAEEEEFLGIYHFVEGQEGIYRVYNDNPEDSSLWLPNDPKPGDTWKDLYSEYEIMDVGVSIEAGGKTFENCIMKKTTTEIVEFGNICYIAPGYGEVYSEYEGGSMEFELIEEASDDSGLAGDVMEGKMKYLEAILNYKEK